MYRTKAVAVVSVLMTAALACGDGGGGEATGPSTEPAAVPAAIVAVSGDRQADTIGATLAEPLAVRVTSATGVGVPDVPLSFQVILGDVSLSNSLTRTDANGLASTTVTLGTRAGSVAVSATSTASALAGARVGFSATVNPGAPNRLHAQSGGEQLRFPGSTLVSPLRAAVHDRADNPAKTSGIAVTWTVQAGGGSIAPMADATDASGLASATWTLGPQEGTNTVEVTAANLAPATFNARAAPAGPIAFTSDRANPGGPSDIFVMNEDGSDVIQLTADPADEFDPAWSPDGTRIAFAREYGGSGSGHYEIVVANADGSGENRITDTPISESNLFPQWSPDGTRIAFSGIGVGGKADVFLINPDGTGRVNITNRVEIDQDPSWSPDGSRIAFMSMRDGDQELYVMNADGSGQTRLTNSTGGAFRPDWSPDGSKILFQSFDGTCSTVRMINADGTDLRLVKNCATVPAWAPDGRRFTASMAGLGGRDLHVIDVQTGDAVNLTNYPARDVWSAWRR